MKCFFSFKDGVKVSDGEINQWLKDSLAAVMKDPDNTASDISSGDTHVSAWKYPSSVDGEFNYSLIVATSDGYASLHVWNEEADTVEFEFRRSEL